MESPQSVGDYRRPLPQYVAAWRDSLLERGWHEYDGHPPPEQSMIEYHVIWRGSIWSGRCRLRDQRWSDSSIPGSHAYLVAASFADVPLRLWREADNGRSPVGPIKRDS
ncbi:hypothetical protein [Salinicola halophilus]|uniref:hypothetical protein n=1 Tax=Salinicola halophilus TaxID=184065 RepID=UPI0013A5FE55|nr:hypothetical protein [Salinicola halophilus]